MRALFSEIAGVYDRMNHVLSLGRDRVWRRRAAALARDGAQTVVDIACGTGDMTFALAARFPHADVTGIDLTPAMLDLAREKNTSLRIGFLEGDAAALPDTLAGTADLVSCAFGFRNMTDLPAVLRAVRRTLKPGGELLVLEFFRARFLSPAWFATVWVKLGAALFAHLHAAAYAHLRDSMRHTVSVRAFNALAAAAGFRLRAHRFFFPCCTCLSFVRAENDAAREGA